MKRSLPGPLSYLATACYDRRMTSLDPFIILAEVSATFVGFVGIAGILGKRSGVRSTALAYIRIQGIIENALIVLAMSLLPVLAIELFEAEQCGFRAFSFVLALAYVFQELQMFRRLRPLIRRGEYEVSAWVFIMWFLKATGVGLSLANGFAAFSNPAAIYGVALGIGLGQSSLALLRFFLGSILVNEGEQEQIDTDRRRKLQCFDLVD